MNANEIRKNAKLIAISRLSTVNFMGNALIQKAVINAGHVRPALNWMEMTGKFDVYFYYYKNTFTAVVAMTKVSLQ